MLTVDEARDWAEEQRRLYRQGRLEKDKIARLEAVPGWTWDTPDGVTDCEWDLIVMYYSRHQERRQRVYRGKTGDNAPYSVPIPNRKLSYMKPNGEFVLRNVTGRLMVIPANTVRKIFEKVCE
jgi:hypothetical protein